MTSESRNQRSQETGINFRVTGAAGFNNWTGVPSQEDFPHQTFSIASGILKKGISLYPTSPMPWIEGIKATTAGGPPPAVSSGRPPGAPGNDGEATSVPGCCTSTAGSSPGFETGCSPGWTTGTEGFKGSVGFLMGTTGVTGGLITSSLGGAYPLPPPPPPDAGGGGVGGTGGGVGGTGTTAIHVPSVSSTNSEHNLYDALEADPSNLLPRVNSGSP